MHIYVEEDGHSPSTREFRLRFGIFQPSEVLKDALYRAYLRKEYERSRIGVPVGPYIDRRDVGQLQSPSIPAMGPATTNIATPGYGGPITGPAALPNQTTIREGQSMDLAGILGGISSTAATIADVRRILNPPVMGGGVGPYIGPGVGTQPVGFPSVVGGAVLGEVAETVYDWWNNGDAPAGLPATVNGGAACATKPSDIVYKWSEKDQRYVARKKYKRRRQRLATKSDIKDLASLKGIVGQGKVMETWIATHC